MKEEDILLKKLGKENSFKVPDGYFEHMDKTETIALYGSYVRRGGLDYPGSVNRS